MLDLFFNRMRENLYRVLKKVSLVVGWFIGKVVLTFFSGPSLPLIHQEVHALVLLSDCLKKYNIKKYNSCECNSTESTASHNNYVISITTRIAPDTVISSRKTPQILRVGSHLTTHHHPVRLGLFRSLIAHNAPEIEACGDSRKVCLHARN